MGQFEQIQTRKSISTNGGVGSIIETRDGSIFINLYNEWPFFESINGQFEDYNLISDKRFKNRISKYFQQLEHLVKIPVNDLKQGYRPENSFALLSAKYFPEWFYCNTCHKFDKFSNWKYNWENSVDTNDQGKFYPPKCFKCYVRNRNNRRKFFDLEQIRFVLTSSNGEIADIPWDKWALLKKTKKKKEDAKENSEINSEENIITLANINVPDDLELEFKTSDKLDDLKGIWIIAKNKSGEQINFSTLSGLFNLRIKIEELIPNTNEKGILFKPVIRTSNSVYYANILSSIYLPANDELNKYSIGIIKDLSEKEMNSDVIAAILPTTNKLNIDKFVIQKLIDNNFSEREAEISKTENEYRFDEYKFITSKEEEKLENLLIFEKIKNKLFSDDLIKSIYKMDKIKITSVQTSYTRQEPISTDLFLKDDDDSNNDIDKIQKKFTSKEGINAKYLPAIESFGEGIFFDFDNDKLNEWINTYPEIQKRIQIIIDNHNNSDSSLNKDLALTPKFILIHTFSHLIIKELEYLCGYPSTSIQERLYIDDNPKTEMNGVLIYTIAGSEGSYGGLTSICDNDKIGKLILSAMMRAKDCATDPICYHTGGQGVGNLNLSACFSCSLLPETSCEMFNCYLDRRILIDKEYGYFKDLYS
ncbi:MULTISPECIES: DUF1998 domain-containing protein [unclassified Flavobacterium]|uniref:DUF1998 domain-containing protein n=1 Tax=unclassified Flavobacterium TaxID=196869 RepID=UPI0025C577B8|nr:MULTISPECIES: DUF1998 domain-containing protein [unclassified Flavobacterium]